MEYILRLKVVDGEIIPFVGDTGTTK